MGSKSSSRPQESTVTQRTEIPGFLQPFVQRQAEIGLGGLESLQGLLDFQRQPEFINQQVQVGSRQVPIPGQPIQPFGGAGAGLNAQPGDLSFGFGQPQFRSEPIFETRQVANPAFDPNFDPDQAAIDRLVAPFAPEQEQAFQQLTDLAGGAGGFLPAAQDALLSTARGDFLFGGQGFDQAVDAALRQAQPNILSTFGGAGRGTGGLAQTAIAQAATDAFARQFGQERQRQLTAASLLPGIAQIGPGLLSGVGAQRRAQTQRERLAPISAAESLLSAAGGGIPLQSLLGQTQTGVTQQQSFSNPFGQILGGVLGIGGLLGGGGLFSEGGIFG